MARDEARLKELEGKIVAVCMSCYRRREINVCKVGLRTTGFILS